MLSKERSGWAGKSKVGDVTETVKYKKEPPIRFAAFVYSQIMIYGKCERLQPQDSVAPR